MGDVHDSLRQALADILGDQSSRIKSAAVKLSAEAEVSISLKHDISYFYNEYPGPWNSGRGSNVSSVAAAQAALASDGSTVFAKALVRLTREPKHWQTSLRMSRSYELNNRYGVEVTCGDCSGSARITCPTCRGSCMQSCPSCHSSGRTRCAICRGRGTVSRNGSSDQHTCYPCSGTGNINCTVCGTSGKISCRPCHASGEVGCGRCNVSGILTLTYHGSVGINSVGTFSTTEKFDPLRIRAFKEHKEVAFTASKLIAPGTKRSHGADFKGAVSYDVVQSVYANESSTFVFVGENPLASVISDPMQTAFQPFFTEAEEILMQHGLPSFVQWGRKRPYAAQLFSDGVAKSEHKAFQLAAERQSPYRPKPFSVRLISLLVPTEIVKNFKAILERFISERASMIAALEKEIFKGWAYVSSASAAVVLGIVGLILYTSGNDFSLDTDTRNGQLWFNNFLGCAFMLLIDFGFYLMRKNDLHERESAALDGNSNVDELVQKHKLKSSIGRFICVMLGSYIIFHSWADFGDLDKFFPKSNQEDSATTVINSTPEAPPVEPVQNEIYTPPEILPNVLGYVMLDAGDGSLDSIVTIGCAILGTNRIRQVRLKRTNSGDSWELADNLENAGSISAPFADIVTKQCVYPEVDQKIEPSDEQLPIDSDLVGG